MSVAVPPTFEAMITGSRKTTDGILSCFAIAIAIGVTKITVVTLSSIADNAAVNQMSRVSTTNGRPPVARISLATPQPNTPVSLSTPTSAIIAPSNSNTLRSMCSHAFSNGIRWYGVR